MSGIRFEVKLRNVIGQVPRALQREAAGITSRALRAGEQRAKAESPVRTGYLRSRVMVRMSSQTGGALVDDASYAGHVNYGTRYMSARPFMTRGAETVENEMRNGWAGIEGRLPHL